MNDQEKWWERVSDIRARDTTRWMMKLSKIVACFLFALFLYQILDKADWEQATFFRDSELLIVFIQFYDPFYCFNWQLLC